MKNAAKPLLDILSKNQERTAVVDPKGRKASYGELLEKINALCRHLDKLGLEPGDRVVLQIPNGIEFAVTALAVLLTGGVPVLVEPGLGDDVYLSRVKASRPKWLLVHPLIIRVNQIPGASWLLGKMELDVPPVPPLENRMKKVIISPGFIDDLVKQNREQGAFDPVLRNHRDDAILIFTGGTTSMPKGVRLSHGAVDYYISHISWALEGLQLENFLADTPQQVLYALRLGKTAYVTKGRKKVRARYVKNLVEKGAIDAYFGSPYIWTEMMALAGENKSKLPATLKTVLLGGAPVTPEFLDTLLEWLDEKTRVMVLYGMTEVGPVCAVSARDKLNYKGHGDLVGQALGNIKLEIAKGRSGEDFGEVIIHSPSLFTGYLGMEELEKGQGMESGDLGNVIEIDDTSMLVLMGRIKDMIIRKGVNIYPGSFEPNIRSFVDGVGQRQVREAALVGLWNRDRQDEDVVCCIQPIAGKKIDMNGLKKWVGKVCGNDAGPDHYIIVDPIPVTGRQNKIDKKQLRKDCAKHLGLTIKKELDS